MKKIIVYIFILLGSIFVSGCNYSTNVEAQKSRTQNKVITANTSSVLSPKQNANVSESDSKLPKIWVGLISSDNGNINSSNNVWSAADDTPTDIPESEGGVKIGTEYNVDIMNCGGYLGSGKIAFVEEGGFPPDWRLKFSPETIAADGVEKVKQCDADTKDNFVNSEAFAIAPQNRNRQDTKIGRVDTRKLFTSLPEEIKRLLDNKYDAEIREKNNLSITNKLLVSNDNWTDIDGDGQVDLISVSISNEKQTESVVLLLIEGKWIKIGEIQPA